MLLQKPLAAVRSKNTPGLWKTRRFLSQAFESQAWARMLED